MKVSELIDLLTEYDQEMEVFFSYNFGDRWKTEVASEIKKVEEETVTHSDYHHMHKVVEEFDPDDQDKYKQVLVLK